MFNRENVAIIVPFYNEGKRWNFEYWARLKNLGFSLFLIDDGSSDNTWEIISNFDSKRSFRLHVNRGKAEAVRFGMLEALKQNQQIEYLAFVDADGAFDIDEVVNILERTSSLLSIDFDAVWTSRVRLSGRDIQRSALRHAIGRFVSTSLSGSYSNFPYDSQSGFKIYRNTSEFKKSLNFSTQTRWFFELEHLANYAFTNGVGLKIWEEPLKYWRDVPGSKVYSLRSIQIFAEVVVVLLKLRSAMKILRKN